MVVAARPRHRFSFAPQRPYGLFVRRMQNPLLWDGRSTAQSESSRSQTRGVLHLRPLCVDQLISAAVKTGHFSLRSTAERCVSTVRELGSTSSIAPVASSSRLASLQLAAAIRLDSLAARALLA